MKKAASKPAAAKPKAAGATPKPKTPSKASAKKKTGGSKPAAPKAAAKPTAKPTKKPIAKKVVKKPAPRKSTASKRAAESKAAEPAAKKTKGTGKKQTSTPKAPATPAEPKPAKKGVKAAGEAAKGSKPVAAPEKPAEKADSGDDKKGGRKGITVVETAKKPASRPKPVSKYAPPTRPMLLGPGSKLNKPLIASGPSAPKQTSPLESPKSRRTKSPFTKAKLDKYRTLLIKKRAELLGDVVSMENEALRSGGSGGLSNTPQHLAEQGSESYDQSLSLNLAAKDRKLIKEIDDALLRIDDGTYGLCELTNLPIAEERLDELPWARYTVEAARQLEARGGYGA